MKSYPRTKSPRLILMKVNLDPSELDELKVRIFMERPPQQWRRKAIWRMEKFQLWRILPILLLKVKCLRSLSNSQLLINRLKLSKVVTFNELLCRSVLWPIMFVWHPLLMLFLVIVSYYKNFLLAYVLPFCCLYAIIVTNFISSIVVLP